MKRQIKPIRSRGLSFLQEDVFLLLKLTSAAVIHTTATSITLTIITTTFTTEYLYELLLYSVLNAFTQNINCYFHNHTFSFKDISKIDLFNYTTLPSHRRSHILHKHKAIADYLVFMIKCSCMTTKYLMTLPCHEIGPAYENIKGCVENILYVF